MRRISASLAALAVALTALALFASTAAATYEATMVPRQARARADGPTFVVEAGGGRRTRIRDLELETGACGSIYAPLLDAGSVKGGFDDGNGSAIFSVSGRQLKIRLELKVSPRGEGLRGSGVLKATVGTCHEKVALDLVSAAIRGGGRHVNG